MYCKSPKFLSATYKLCQGDQLTRRCYIKSRPHDILQTKVVCSHLVLVQNLGVKLKRQHDAMVKIVSDNWMMKTQNQESWFSILRRELQERGQARKCPDSQL